MSGTLIIGMARSEETPIITHHLAKWSVTPTPDSKFDRSGGVKSDCSE